MYFTINRFLSKDFDLIVKYMLFSYRIFKYISIESYTANDLPSITFSLNYDSTTVSKLLVCQM